MFKTYPDLAGIGLTTGENMPDSDAVKKEDKPAKKTEDSKKAVNA